MFRQLKLLPGSSLEILRCHFYGKIEWKFFTPKILPPEQGEICFDRKNSCRHRLRSPLWTILTKKKWIKNFTPKFQPPKKGWKNIMTAKLPAEIVFVVPCKPFSQKKSNKKISPPTFNPREGVKNDMSAKIPTGIVFVVPSKPFSQKNQKQFFSPLTLSPFFQG